MAYYEKRIYSGDYLEIERYSFTSRNTKFRERKGKISCEAQKKLNFKNSERKLMRLMNTNFKNKEDLFVTLTFKIKINETEARKEFEKFIRRLKYFRKKNGMDELKYISCIGEDNSTGIHFHMVMNKISLDDLRFIWCKGNFAGRFQISTLIFSEQNGLGQLASYFMKQELKRNKNIEEDEIENRKRLFKKWSASKNLKAPLIKTKIIKRFCIKEKSRDIKGYKTVFSEISVNDITGESQQYIQLARVMKNHSKDG